MLNALLCLAAGLTVLAVVWLPLFFRESALTLPLFAVASGAIFFSLSPRDPGIAQGFNFLPDLTQVVLIFAVMGAGLQIDRVFSFEGWASTWRLLLLVMPLAIALTAALAILTGIPFAEAIILGAILAPTDPVMAASVGLGPPGKGEEGEVRFALTSEAGLNDGFAFPFVTLGIGLLSAHGEWAGFVRINQALPGRFRLSTSGEGLAVLGIMSLVYDSAQLISANGLMAVFTAGAAIRQNTRGLEYTQVNYAFSQQLERLLVTITLFFFGGMALGVNFSGFGGVQALFVFLALFAVRPVATVIAFWGAKETWPERLAIGYLGIRGIGTLFYLFYAIAQHASKAVLLPTVAVAVLTSIAVYGLTGPYVMKLLEQREATRTPDIRQPKRNKRRKLDPELSDAHSEEISLPDRAAASEGSRDEARTLPPPAPTRATSGLAHGLMDERNLNLLLAFAVPILVFAILIVLILISAA
jgi:NhaP-type Na+/H+ or K+/H+ antiporter